MILICGTLSVLAAGRALGADAWLRRHTAGGRSALPALVRAAA